MEIKKINVCHNCGYELFPLDRNCDKCGVRRKDSEEETDVVPAVKKAKESSKAKETSKPKKSEKTKEQKKTEKDTDSKKTEKVKESSGSAAKVLIIVGSILGGLLVACAVTAAIIYALKSGSIMGEDDDYEDEYYDEYYDEEYEDDYEDEYYDDSQDYEDEYFEEEYEEPEEPEIVDDEPVESEESDNQEEPEATDEEEDTSEEPEEEGSSEDEEPVDGSEVIGQTFNVGQDITYDKVTYKVSSFNEYSDPDESFGEPDEGCKWYELSIEVVNNSDEERDVDVYGTYYENGEEMYTYTSFEKDSYATLAPGQSANLGVIVSRSDSASSGTYTIDIGYYYGESVTIQLF